MSLLPKQCKGVIEANKNDALLHQISLYRYKSHVHHLKVITFGLHFSGPQDVHLIMASQSLNLTLTGIEVKQHGSKLNKTIVISMSRNIFRRSLLVYLSFQIFPKYIRIKSAIQHVMFHWSHKQLYIQHLIFDMNYIHVNMACFIALRRN